MKRSIFGAGMLALLLILGVAAQWGIARQQDPVAQTLDKAAEAALDGDWERVDTLIGQAHKTWQQGYDLSAALADHEPLEKIDAQFASLKVWQKERSAPMTAAGCAELASQIRALVEEQRFSWKTLL